LQHQGHQSHPGITNGQAATGHEVFAAPPGGEFCLACKPSHDWITVYAPTCALFPSSDDLEFASRAGSLLLKPPPRVTRRFASLARRFLHAAESEPLILGSPSAVESYRLALLAATRDLFASGLHSEGRHFVRWRDQARASAELAMRHPDDSLSVAELARRVGVPERTLRTAFQRCYGLSPLKCLRLIRLHRARQLLRASCPDETTVTKVAVGLGFWDLGRFAGAYRQLFRELPSETLRRTASDRRAT
jgi:AraC-like DNA-binding protein